MVGRVQTLGEDILLLAIRSNGTIGASHAMRFALAGSELVRLAALRRIEIVNERIVVVDPTPTGDALIDAELRSMGSGRRPPRAKTWVALPRENLVESYLKRLEAAGVIRAEQRKVLRLFPVVRWVVVDVARVVRVRARLDVIAHSSGPVDMAQAALGGLVHAIDLDKELYVGWDGPDERRRLKEITARDRTAHSARSTVYGAGDTAAHTATGAAIRATSDAATSASLQAATDAAVDAAISASVDAAHDATSHHGSHDGGGGGGHHH